MEYIRLQEDLICQMKNNKANFKKSPKEKLTKQCIDSRLKSIEQKWKEFTQNHSKIILSEKDYSKHNYFVNNLHGETEEFYLEFSSQLSELLDQRSAASRYSDASDGTTEHSAHHSGTSVKLPKIKIPTFSGKYTEWSSFRDLFTSLIHNNKSIDDVQRLHYLKTQLSGEAEQLIRHVPITQLNYVKCWDMLTKRYNNKKFVSNCILKRLFSQRQMLTESSNSLKELLDTTSDCMHELTNLGVDVKSWDIIVIYIVALKLDAETRKQWELQVNKSSEDLPTFSEFKEFLEIRFRALECIEPKSKPKTTFNSASSFNSRPKVLHLTSNISCPVCSESHKLSNCKKFAKDDVEQRRATVESLNLCFNCLGKNHSAKLCRMSTKCRVCKRKHHSLLHPRTGADEDVEVAFQATGSQYVDKNAATPSSSLNEVSNIAAHFSKGNIHRQVLLATAIVQAESKNGSFQVLRALLDQGSQASFISEAAVQLLKLKKVHARSAISGLGGNQSGVVSKYAATVNIQSLTDSKFQIRVKAHVLGNLTSVLPERKFELPDWPDLQKITLADPDFNSPNKIDILLGAEVYCHILKEGLLKGPQNSPIAQDTYLGWILSGHVDVESKAQNFHNIISMHTQVEENDLLKKFWELESDHLLNVDSVFTPEEQACEDYFKATTQRDPDGRYVVCLPFRDDNPLCKFGNSRSIALKRFQGLERKFSNNADFKKQYIDVINEYVQLGHMEQISDERKNKPDAVYLSHHAVVREDKTTTKTRVVFDASCKGTNGVSLNDSLMVGPTLQSDLRHILMRWREHPVCLAADIIKMYRQVKVAEKDVDYQRIVWRENVDTEIKDYRLLRVTFGTSSAPYLAVKALQQTARDEGHAYPLAAERVLNDFYVDDLMTGCQTETEAMQIYHEINELLAKSGFILHKWTSNKEELLVKLKEKAIEFIGVSVPDKITKILGLTWNGNTDEFDYTIHLPPTTGPATKRKIISDISRLYDPLGWLSPCIITSKIFIQKLWLSGLEWDEELPLELLKEWEIYRKDLTKLVDFHITRWLGRKANDAVVELHGFSDASNAAYAAAVYIRIIDSEGKVNSHLVTAKTKVAPIKQISIPRLELCGAQLVAKLLVEVANVFNIPKAKVHAWTDSTVVLAWLSDHPSRWKTFVANRTSEILNAVDANHWAHVNTKENPADCASRGILPTDLLENLLWKNGPSWLCSEVIEYSKPKTSPTKLEEKSIKAHVTAIDENSIDRLWTKFSSLQKLVRVLAFCRRFLRFRQPRDVRCEQKPYLTAPEIQDALEVCIRQSQAQYFYDEMRDLQNKKCLNKKSILATLNPFIDDNGLLRVGGRLRQSSLSESMKHPLIIPHDAHLAKLLIADAHKETFHGGQQLLLNFLRTKYWVLKAKNLARNHIHNCVTCFRYAAETRQQLMGQLPSCRVTPSKPFLHSGVDYAGPINIRVSKGRGNKSYKGYICLFVCMATRAVHIESVSDMTSEGFLAAFKRFVARRGHCSDLWSDNGTNFVGASKELRILFDKERSSMSSEIASALANNGTEWHFIPPHAPNFGGLWEAGIKSAKNHLKRVIGDSTLTFEEISTVLAQIEACLNSRPMSAASSDPDDAPPLCPGHFLVGQPLVIAPDYNFESVQIGSLRRWQMTQRMVQNFWRRWTQEYLSQFFQRYKWSRGTSQLKVDDLVIVKEDNLPPTKWLYGRVVELHPGRDNITRVVTLRCKNSLIKRPTSKLCPLPKSE